MSRTKHPARDVAADSTRGRPDRIVMERRLPPNSQVNRILRLRAQSRLPTDAAHERQADEVADYAIGRRRSPVIGFNGGVTAKPRSSEIPSALLDGGGSALSPRLRRRLEPITGGDLSRVRVHNGSAADQAAALLRARAFTYQDNIWLGRNESATDPDLMGHEVAHVVQQQKGLRAPTLQCRPVASYGTPWGDVWRPGDAGGQNILTRIEITDGQPPQFTWYNFSTGNYVTGDMEEWRLRRLSGAFLHTTAGFQEIGSQLSPEQWQSLGEDPGSRLLEMFDSGQLSLSDEKALAVYQGVIYDEAIRQLDENEQAIDQLLEASDRVSEVEEYATGLREASIIRDTLQSRVDDIEHSLVQTHAPGFGFAGRHMNFNPARRLNLIRRQALVQRSLDWWYSAFPLLSRLKTAEITPGRVISTFQKIKSDIVSTRQQLDLARSGRGDLDLMSLDNIRAAIEPNLGDNSRRVVEEEDASRRRWGWIVGGLMLAGSIALLFVPGGIFIDIAVGLAIAAKSVNEAAAIGRAANTGLHVDAGLMSQAQSDWADFGAVLAVIGAALGAAAGSFRVLRVARAFRMVGRVAPELGFASRVNVARAIGGTPELLAAPRTTGSLREILAESGTVLNAGELNALRQLSYVLHEAGVAGTSRQALDSFLESVWSDRGRILAAGNRLARRGREPYRAVYSMYAAASDPNVLTRSADEYLEEIAEIASARGADALSNVQGVRLASAAGDQITAQVARGGSNLPNAFFRFQRAGVSMADLSERITQRVYLNVAADEATATMRVVVREIIDDAERYPGVLMAKLSGPSAVARRGDSIVIYAESVQAAERVLVRIRELQRANPAAFGEVAPALTEPVMRGVGVAAEPVGAVGQSFGTVRSAAIYDALQASSTREQFVENVLAELSRRGVDVDFPHLNIPTTPAGVIVPPAPGDIVGPGIRSAGEVVDEE